jgi:hypothetical protein
LKENLRQLQELNIYSVVKWGIEKWIKQKLI